MATGQRMSVSISKQLDQEISDMAAETGCSRSEVIRIALALRLIAHRALKQGLHIGIVSNPDKLDTVIVGIP